MTAACAGISKDGPLSMGGDPGELCMLSDPGATMGLGDIGTLELTGNDADGARIISVNLVDLEGAEVVDQYVVPVVDMEAVMGVDPADPPQGWAAREPASGYQLDAAETASFVVTVKKTGTADVRAAAVRVEYSVGGVSYEAQGTTRMRLAAACG